MALKKCKECGAEISKKAKECPKCGAPQGPKQYSIGKLIVVGVFGYFVYTLVTETSQTSSSGPSPKQVAMKSVELEFAWEKTGFDNVMEADFVIKNDSEYDIKDIEITCTHYAKSGSKIDSNTREIYDIVPSKSSKTFADFSMGFIHTQVDSTSCSIIDFKI